MRVLIAPTALKGSLGAVEVSSALQQALEKLDSSWETVVCPLADGGDDTLAVLEVGTSRLNEPWQRQTAVVMGPIPSMTVKAPWLWQPETEIAVVEAAKVHGMTCLLRETGLLAPMAATSYGVGALIKAILAHHHCPNPRQLVVGLGGSASTDGGLGALQALGATFANQSGQAIRIPLSGNTLMDVGAVDFSSLKTIPPLTIATDVTNPLLGPQGTATIFAPQKGATSQQCEQLEAGLSHVQRVIQKATNTDYSKTPGAGAAGGLAYGLLHVPGSQIISGVDWVLETIGFQQHLDWADGVITAEGCLDHTSLSGKVIGRLIELTQAQEKPLLILCGSVAENLALPAHVQVVAFDQWISVEQAMLNPKEALVQALQIAWPQYLASARIDGGR